MHVLPAAIEEKYQQIVSQLKSKSWGLHFNNMWPKKVAQNLLPLIITTELIIVDFQPIEILSRCRNS